MAKNEAKAVIGLNAKPFEAGAKLAIAASKQMSSAIKASITTATGVIAGTAVIGAVGKLASGISNLTTGGISLSASMADLAAETGLAADEALKYDFALRNGLSNKAAEQLMGKAAANIGNTAEVFRNLKIRLESIWLNMQAAFSRLAGFFAPVVDQVLSMAESIDWDTWIKSAEEFIKPVRDGILAITQLVKEKRIWEVAGKVMELGFAKANNVFLNGLEKGKALAAAIPNILDAGLKSATNVIIFLGKKLGSILREVFGGSGKLLGKAILSGVTSIGSTLVSKLTKIFAFPIAIMSGLLAKAISELIESVPDWAKPDNLKDFKAPDFHELVDDALNFTTGEFSGIFEKQAKDSAKDFKSASDDFKKRILSASSSVKLEDLSGAGDSLANLKDRLEDFGKIKSKDFTGAGKLQEDLADTFKGALSRVKDPNRVNTKSIVGINPIFGGADSLTSVGGGGGVGTGLMGVLDESRRQTRLQERMVDLLGSNTELQTSEPPRSGGLTFI